MESLSPFGKAQQPLHFITFLEKLVAQFKPLQVYQYATFTQQTEVQSIFAETQQQAQMVFYLLVVTEGSASMEREIQRFADQQYQAAKVVLQVHSHVVFQRSLAARHAYFSAVVLHGVLCYFKEGAAAISEVLVPNPKKRLGKAIVFWRNRNNMAQGFAEAAEQALAYNHERICLYLLYQATAQVCMGLIWVFMGYQLATRNVKRLLYTCGCFSPVTLQHFIGTLENQKLLEVMMKCYRDLGDEENFSLEGKSIYRFVELVQGFLELADRQCQARFKVLEKSIG